MNMISIVVPVFSHAKSHVPPVCAAVLMPDYTAVGRELAADVCVL